MRTWSRPSLICLMLILFSFPSYAQGGTCSGMSLGPGASLNGFVPFPASDLWNKDISSEPVDPKSGDYIDFIGLTSTLHPDFGSGTWAGQYMGIASSFQLPRPRPRTRSTPPTSMGELGRPLSLPSISHSWEAGAAAGIANLRIETRDFKFETSNSRRWI